MSRVPSPPVHPGYSDKSNHLAHAIVSCLLHVAVAVKTLPQTIRARLDSAYRSEAFLTRSKAPDTHVGFKAAAYRSLDLRTYTNSNAHPLILYL
jgi:hypothetical protein